MYTPPNAIVSEDDAERGEVFDQDRAVEDGAPNVVIVAQDPPAVETARDIVKLYLVRIPPRGPSGASAGSGPCAPG